MTRGRYEDCKLGCLGRARTSRVTHCAPCPYRAQASPPVQRRGRAPSPSPDQAPGRLSSLLCRRDSRATPVGSFVPVAEKRGGRCAPLRTAHFRFLVLGARWIEWNLSQVTETFFFRNSGRCSAFSD